MNESVTPYGLCHCGCLGETTRPKITSLVLGRIKGVPLRYILGHSRRGMRQPCPDCGSTAGRMRENRLCGGRCEECHKASKRRAWKNEHPIKNMPGDVARRHLWKKYLESAKQRGIEMAITFEYATKLFQMDCHYCDDSPKTIHQRPGMTTGYVHNGIDRLHNHMGYTIENCVPCCRSCNFIKRNTAIDVWMAFLQRVAVKYSVRGG